MRQITVIQILAVKTQVLDIIVEAVFGNAPIHIVKERRDLSLLRVRAVALRQLDCGCPHAFGMNLPFFREILLDIILNLFDRVHVL